MPGAKQSLVTAFRRRGPMRRQESQALDLIAAAATWPSKEQGPLASSSRICRPVKMKLHTSRCQMRIFEGGPLCSSLALGNIAWRTLITGLEEPPPCDLLLTQRGRTALVETDPGGTCFCQCIDTIRGDCCCDATLPLILCGDRGSLVTAVLGVLYGRFRGRGRGPFPPRRPRM